MYHLFSDLGRTLDVSQETQFTPPHLKSMELDRGHKHCDREMNSVRFSGQSHFDVTRFLGHIYDPRIVKSQDIVTLLFILVHDSVGTLTLPLLVRLILFH